MCSKFFIFVVFATLARSSFAQLSQIYGLSENATTVFYEIIYNQEAMLVGKFDGFNPLFDVLNKLSVFNIWNLTIEVDEPSSRVEEALSRVKDAIDYSLTAVLLVVDESCSDVEIARKSSHADLEHVYAQFPIAIELASYGDYSDSRTAIDELQATVQKDLANLVGSYYNAIRTCLDATDDDTLNIIKIAEDGSSRGLIHAGNAVFNAIKIYAAVVSDGSQDLGVINAIEETRSYALAGLRADVEHKSSLLKTLFINSELGLSEIVSHLNSIQYSTTVSTHKYEAGTESIFETIVRSLTGLALGFFDVGDNDFSLTDVAQAKTAAELRAGLRIFADSVLNSNPDAAAVAWENFATLSDEVTAFYYDTIFSIQVQNTNCTEALENFEMRREELLSVIPNFIDDIFKLIRNGSIWDEDVEAEITTLQNSATTSVTSFSSGIFGSMEILLTASCEGPAASSDDFSWVQIFHNEAVRALDDFTYAIAAGRVITLTADNSN